MEAKIEFGIVRSILGGHVGPIPFKAWFQYHIFFMSNIRNLNFPLESLYSFLVRIQRHEVLHTEVFVIRIRH